MQQAHLFVAVLGASSYTYSEATGDEQLASWIGAHVRAFEFYQGVPKLVVPDNTKTGVTKACRYDPDLNPTSRELSARPSEASSQKLACPAMDSAFSVLCWLLRTLDRVSIGRYFLSFQPQPKLFSNSRNKRFLRQSVE